jgi:hypothetical protein
MLCIGSFLPSPEDFQGSYDRNQEFEPEIHVKICAF